jgi:hypothetical protein
VVLDMVIPSSKACSKPLIPHFTAAGNPAFSISLKDDPSPIGQAPRMSKPIWWKTPGEPAVWRLLVACIRPFLDLRRHI